MKLASALSERADLQTRLSDLKRRLNNNAKIQEGEEATENPVELIAEITGIIEKLEDLMARINLTNSSIKCADGRTLTEVLAHRDCLKMRYHIMRDYLDEASSKVNRFSRTEIKILSAVDVPAFQKQVDLISKELRETDELLQEMNWTTELL